MNEENKVIAFQYAKDCFPREACGLVVIHKGKEEFIPCKNISELDDNFEIDAEDYVRAEELGEVVEVFHSHPNGHPTPSETDLVSCERTQLPWSIVSVSLGTWIEFKPSGYKAPLVGRTWAHGVLDCYSIIVDYYREVLKIEIPDFDRDFEWWMKGQNLYEENFAKAGFREIEVTELKPHDVILFQIMSPVTNHGGVYLGDEKFLHHLHRRLSSRDIFSGYYFKHAVKFLRHRELDENGSSLRRDGKAMGPTTSI